MANPVEVLNSARKQAGKAAALSAALTGLPVAGTLATFGLLLSITSASWLERYGVLLTPQVAHKAEAVIFALVFLVVLATLAGASQAYLKASRPQDVAARIDRELAAKEEIVTFAEASFSEDSGSSATARSPLFPLLSDRVAGYLESFEPSRIFAIPTRRVVLRSSLTSLCVLITAFTALLVYARLTQPPYASQIETLHELASKLAESSPSPENAVLAKRLAAVADVLANPALTAREKLERIAALKREVEELERRETAQKNPQSSSAGSSGSAHNKGSGSGENSGNEPAGSGNGEGQNERNQGGGGKKPSKRQTTSSPVNEANREIAEIERELEQQSRRSRQSSTGFERPNDHQQQEASADTGPGENPTKSSGPKPGVNEPQKGNQPEPEQKLAGANAKENLRSPRRGTGLGDTRLGEIPAPANYKRFYAFGEHGPGLTVKDARYVVVSLPPAPQAASGGKIVAGGPSAKATTPYANLPLPKEDLAANPQQQQLVPPRYWDLLR